MLIKRFSLLILILSLSAVLMQAQVTPEPVTIVIRKPVEREIAGGESHTYQLTLQPGQFLRVVVEQKGIDVAIALVSPDGRQLLDSDLTGAREPLSYQATAAGNYQMVIRANGAATMSGAYHVLIDLKDAAAEQDRKRMAAEQLLNEAGRLRAQGRSADPQLIEKLGQALALWREMDDAYWQGFALNFMGGAHFGARQYDKAIEPYEQALALWRGVKMRAGEGNVLANLGNAYFYTRKYEKAVEYYEQALPIYRELKNRTNEAIMLNGLGISYLRLSRSPGRSVESCTGRDVEAEAMAIALLLGGVCDAGRMEVRRCRVASTSNRPKYAA